MNRAAEDRRHVVLSGSHSHLVVALFIALCVGDMLEILNFEREEEREGIITEALMRARRVQDWHCGCSYVQRQVTIFMIMGLVVAVSE